jgi:hypothetical protein
MLDLAIHLLIHHYAKNPSRATVALRGWKQHTCVHCGGQFQYWMERKQTRRGASKDAARESAGYFAHSRLRNEADWRPCPTCGLYQPEMVAARRFRLHVIVFLALSCVLFLSGTGLFAAGMHMFIDGDRGAIFAPWIVAVLVGAGLFAHLVIDLIDANRNMQANRDAAWALIDRGAMVEVKAGDRFAAMEPAASAGWRRIGQFCLIVVVLLLIPACEVMRLVNGWPINDGCKPVIVAPGDRVKVYFPKTITSVNGFWKADGRAELLNANELNRGPELKLSSKNDQWGKFIAPKKNEAHGQQRLWADIELPDDAKLAGRTLQIKMDLQVVYPTTPVNFQNTQENVTHTVTLALAANREAASTYMVSYWIGGMAGLILAFCMNAAIVLRTKSLRSQGLPTEIHLID